MPTETPNSAPNDLASFVRKNPGMYFQHSRISGTELAAQLLEYVKALGCSQAESLELAGWHVVRSEQDWFTLARFAVPEDLRCTALLAAPEWAQNTTRPEALIGALSERVVVSKGGKLTVSASDSVPNEVLDAMSAAKWQRAIAFSGVR